MVGSPNNPKTSYVGQRALGLGVNTRPIKWFVNQEEPAEGIHGLAQGSLEVTFPLLAEETVTVYRADVGFWIGDDSGFDRTPRLVGLVATKPSRLLHIANRDIRMLLERSPHYWQAFQKLNASNLKKAVTLLSEALSLSVRARVCRRLYEMTRGRHGFDAEITQSDLARLVGVSRPTMRRCLKGLSNLGIVTLKYGKVAIPDHTALKLFFDER